MPLPVLIFPLSASGGGYNPADDRIDGSATPSKSHFGFVQISDIPAAFSLLGGGPLPP
jgi:hypothetical protein